MRRRLSSLGSEFGDWACSITWFRGIAYIPCYLTGLAVLVGHTKRQPALVSKPVFIGLAIGGGLAILAWTYYANRRRSNSPST